METEEAEVINLMLVLGVVITGQTPGNIKAESFDLFGSTPSVIKPDFVKINTPVVSIPTTSYAVQLVTTQKFVKEYHVPQQIYFTTGNCGSVP